jgi:hypothetical protein
VGVTGAALLTALVALSLSACTPSGEAVSTDASSPSPTGASAPHTTAGSPTADPVPSPTGAPTPTETVSPIGAGGAEYDLAAAYTECVVQGRTIAALDGSAAPFSADQVHQASTYFYTADEFASDPTAVAMSIEWTVGSPDVPAVLFVCSVSGPFESPSVVLERTVS